MSGTRFFCQSSQYETFKVRSDCSNLTKWVNFKLNLHFNCFESPAVDTSKSIYDGIITLYVKQLEMNAPTGPGKHED